jgi:hypothetical protein
MSTTKTETPAAEPRDWVSRSKVYKPMTRAAFEGMAAADQHGFITAGGRVVDDPVVEVVAPALDDKTVLRSTFDGMPTADRAAFFKDGGKVID